MPISLSALTRRLGTLALGGLLLAAALPAAIAPAQAQQQPSPAAMAMARELIAAKGALNMFDPVVPGVIETAKNTLLRTSPNLSKDLNEVAAQLRQEFAGKRIEIETILTRIYAQAFTEGELKDALAFYKTPLGQKIIQQEPQVLEQSMGQVQSWGDQFADQMLSRIRAEMKKRGHNL